MRLAAAAYAIVSSWGCVLAYSVASNYVVGGIFDSFFNESVVASSTAAVDTYYHLMAFLMAVDEVNNKTDGIGDQLLPATILAPYVKLSNWNSSLPRNEYFEGYSAAHDIYTSSGSSNLIAIVSASGTKSTDASLSFSSGSGISEFVTNTPTTEFSHGFRYPNLLRMLAAETYQAISLGRWMFWADVAIFYSTNSFGMDCYKRFSLTATTVKILEAVSVPPSTTDFSDYIRRASDSGAKVFLLFLGASQTGLWMEQAYNAKLLTLDTQVLGTSEAADASIWKVMSSGADVPAIMRGYLTMVPGQSLFLQTVRGQSFLKRLQALQSKPAPATSTSGAVSFVADFCYTHSKDLNGLCGLYDVFSNTLNVTEQLHLHPNVLYTYDSIFTLANTIQAMQEQQQSISSTSLHDRLLEKTAVPSSYAVTPISGEVSFFSGVRSSNYFGRGERRASGIYRILNFNAPLYAASSGAQGFVEVGYYSEESKLVLCGEGIYRLFDCRPVVYNTAGDGSEPPSGKYPDVIVWLPEAYLNINYAAVAVIILTHLICAAFLVQSWTEKEIRHSQPKLLVMMIISGFWVAATLLLQGMVPSADVCKARYCFTYLAFTFLFVPSLLKLWRMHKIVNATSTWQLTITDNRLFGYFLLVFGPILVLLVAIMAGARFEMVPNEEIVKNQRFIYPTCSSPLGLAGVVSNVFLVLYLFFGLFFTAAWFLWITRGVPAFFSEIRVISPALAVSLALIIAIVTINAVLHTDSRIKFLLTIALYFIMSILITAGYFIKKATIIRARFKRIENFRSIAGLSQPTEDNQNNLTIDPNVSFRVGRSVSNACSLNARQPTGAEDPNALQLTDMENSARRVSTASTSVAPPRDGKHPLVDELGAPIASFGSEKPSQQATESITLDRVSNAVTDSNAVEKSTASAASGWLLSPRNYGARPVSGQPLPEMGSPRNAAASVQDVASRRSSLGNVIPSLSTRFFGIFGSSSNPNTQRQRPALHGFHMDLTESCESYGDSIGFINNLINRDLTNIMKMKLCSEQVFLWKTLMRKLEMIYENASAAGDILELRFERDPNGTSGQYILVEGARPPRQVIQSAEDMSALTRSSGDPNSNRRIVAPPSVDNPYTYPGHASHGAAALESLDENHDGNGDDISTVTMKYADVSKPPVASLPNTSPVNPGKWQNSSNNGNGATDGAGSVGRWSQPQDSSKSPSEKTGRVGRYKQLEGDDVL